MLEIKTNESEAAARIIVGIAALQSTDSYADRRETYERSWRRCTA